MTQDDIVKMTRQAGGFDATPEFLERFATLMWKDGFNRGFKSGHDWADKMRETKQEHVRPWKGLTKEERHEISMTKKPYVADIMAAHEEELKRKNT